MKSDLIDGFKKSSLKEKLIWTALFTVIICFTVWITLFSINKGENSIENKIINELGSANISDIDINNQQSELNIAVDLKKGTEMQRTLLYMQLCKAIKDEIISNNDYKNMKKISIECSQEKQKVATLTCDNISEFNFTGKDIKSGSTFSVGMLGDDT